MPRVLDDEDQGPAYAAGPRDARRKAVDSTFNDMVSNAKAMKGSVFDTGFDKALRFGASDPHGGLGVVTNPANPVFRDLSARVPRFAGSLQKMKQLTEYIPKKAGDFKRNVLGVTTGVPDDVMDDLSRFAASGRTLPGPVSRTAPELSRLHELNSAQSGSTLQSIRPTLSGNEAEAVPIHEGLHALWAKKFPQGQVPESARAEELLMRVLKRANIPMPQKEAIFEQYAGDPNHGLAEAIAQFINAKAKHGMGVR